MLDPQTNEEVEAILAHQDPAENNDEVSIEVVADPVRDKRPWRKDPSSVLEDVNPDDYSRGVKKTINKLTAGMREAERQREVERQRAEEATRIAQSLAAENKRLQSDAIKRSIEARSTEAESFNRSASVADEQYQQALREGDVAKIAKAQADATTARIKAEYARNEAETLKKVPVPADAPVPRVPRAEPTESASVANWKAQNAWFSMKTSPDGSVIPANKLSATAVAAHHDFLLDGGVQGSPEYFEHIDKAVREKYPEEFGIKKGRPLTPTTREDEDVAPPSRPNTMQGNRLTFSKDQLNMAERLGLYKPSLGLNDPENKKGLAYYAAEIASRGNK